MKQNYFYLVLLGLLLVACNDDLTIVDGPLTDQDPTNQVDPQIDPKPTTDPIPVADPIPDPNTNLTGADTEEETAIITDVIFEDRILSENNQPLKDATITLYANSVRYSAVTNYQGRYRLVVPASELPRTGFISMSIVIDDYKPKNITYSAPLFQGKSYDTSNDNLMLPCPDCLIVGDDKSSELYHLGDDRFGGSINSQFQKTSDGLELTFPVMNSENFAQLRISFEAKGLQPDEFAPGASVFFNESLGDREYHMEKSPEDGSYGSYSFTIDNRPAVTTLTFKTRNQGAAGSDNDDWEFTCLHVEAVR